MPLSRRTLPLLLPAALAACATPGPEIRSDYDHDADFGRFRSFGWAAPPATDRAGFATLTTERLKAAVRDQMESRGYVFATHAPDLLANFHIRPPRRTETEVVTQPGFGPPGYYGWRFYRPWPAWGFGEETIVSRYTEGTLHIDLIDRAKNQLVWEGVAIGGLTRRDLDERAGAIDLAVAAIFDRYPFVAGSGRQTGRSRS